MTTETTETNAPPPVLTAKQQQALKDAERAALNEEARRRMARRRHGYAPAEYFAGPDLPVHVWLQNISDRQISLEIEQGPGQDPGRIQPIPATPDPVDLAEFFQVEHLKNSANLRKILSKRRHGKPLAILIDDTQAEAYWRAKARILGLGDDIEAARAHADKERDQLVGVRVDDQEASLDANHQFSLPKSAQELVAMEMNARGVGLGPDGRPFVSRQSAGQPGSGEMYLNEVINPRVQQICLQASGPDDGGRMPCDDLMQALQRMAPTLKADDFAWVESHGVYPVVRRWARQQHARLIAEESGEDFEEPIEAPIPTAVPAPRAQVAAQYEGPTGFVNAPFAQMRSHVEPLAPLVVGPDGSAL